MLLAPCGIIQMCVCLPLSTRLNDLNRCQKALRWASHAGAWGYQGPVIVATHPTAMYTAPCIG